MKCTKFDFGWGSASDPAREAYSAPLDSLAGFKGSYYVTSKGRNGRKSGEKRGRERRVKRRGKKKARDERGKGEEGKENKAPQLTLLAMPLISIKPSNLSKAHETRDSL